MLDSSIVTHFQFSRCLWDAKCLESCKDLLKAKCLLQLPCWISSLFPANKAKPCVVPQTAFTMTSLPLSSLRNHFWMGVRPHTITAKEISDTCTAIPETAQSGFAMTLGQIIYSFVGIYWPEVARHKFLFFGAFVCRFRLIWLKEPGTSGNDCRAWKHLLHWRNSSEKARMSHSYCRGENWPVSVHRVNMSRAHQCCSLCVDQLPAYAQSPAPCLGAHSCSSSSETVESQLVSRQPSRYP